MHKFSKSLDPNHSLEKFSLSINLSLSSLSPAIPPPIKVTLADDLNPNTYSKDSSGDMLKYSVHQGAQFKLECSSVEMGPNSFPGEVTWYMTTSHSGQHTHIHMHITKSLSTKNIYKIYVNISSTFLLSNKLYIIYVTGSEKTCQIWPLSEIDFLIFVVGYEKRDHFAQKFIFRHVAR